MRAKINYFFQDSIEFERSRLLKDILFDLNKKEVLGL